MRHFPLIILVALALPASAHAEWSCGDAIYASELCPWFDPPADGFAAPAVGRRWSSDGYLVGSAVGRWNDGIHVIVNLPHSEALGAATLWIDIGYEPHWRPDKARALEPAALILRLGEAQWRADAPRPLPPAHDDQRWLHYFEAPLYRFTFDVDVVAAMLTASDVAPRSYGDLYGDAPRGVLRMEILFRDADGGIVSSNDILEIDSGTCETRCQPRLSLAGFAEAYNRSAADADE